MTINEAMIWQAQLKERLTELQTLRNQNAQREHRYLANTDKEIVNEPLYDVVHLDSMINRIANDLRKLNLALKSTNAITEVAGYAMDESVIGELKHARTIAELQAQIETLKGTA